MSNAYTHTTGAAAGTVGGLGTIQKAYDRLLDFALRDEPLIRSVADKRPASLGHNSNTIVMQLYADLTEQTTALTDATERDSVEVPAPTSVTITLAEYGNSVLTTKAFKLFSLTEVDPAIASIIAFNMSASIDTVAQAELRGGSNIIYGGTRTNTVTIAATDTITSANVRKAVAKLRAGLAKPKKGGLYWCGIHPEVSHDLRAETGAGGWRLPHEYASNQQIWNGEIGSYEGAYFVESARMYNATDGASSAKVYRTILCGKEAMAQAVAEEPHTVIGPELDHLRRFRPMGWYGVLGFKRYREAAIYRILNGSSIA